MLKATFCINPAMQVFDDMGLSVVLLIHLDSERSRTGNYSSQRRRSSRVPVSGDEPKLRQRQSAEAPSGQTASIPMRRRNRSGQVTWPAKEGAYGALRRQDVASVAGCVRRAA